MAFMARRSTLITPGPSGGASPIKGISAVVAGTSSGLTYNSTAATYTTGVHGTTGDLITAWYNYAYNSQTGSNIVSGTFTGGQAAFGLGQAYQNATAGTDTFVDSQTAGTAAVNGMFIIIGGKVFDTTGSSWILTPGASSRPSVTLAGSADVGLVGITGASSHAQITPPAGWTWFADVTLGLAGSCSFFYRQFSSSGATGTDSWSNGTGGNFVGLHFYAK